MALNYPKLLYKIAIQEGLERNAMFFQNRSSRINLHRRQPTNTDYYLGLSIRRGHQRGGFYCLRDEKSCLHLLSGESKYQANRLCSHQKGRIIFPVNIGR